MRSHDDVTLSASLRETPVRTGLVAVVPVILAFVQLVNGLFTELPLLVGVGFACTMLAASVIFTRHHMAQLRVEILESGVQAHHQPAD